MSMPINRDGISNLLWRAIDLFRGAMDPIHYKDYIFIFIVWKYISDIWIDRYEEYKLQKKFEGDEELIEKAINHEYLAIPKGTDFYSVLAKARSSYITDEIQKSLHIIERANPDKLAGVFGSVDFNHLSGDARNRSELFHNLFDILNNSILDFRPSRNNVNTVGFIYGYLIELFVSELGSRIGEFYTPPQVSKLIARLVDPQPGERICDPTCGSGSLLIQCANEISTGNFNIYGQEINTNTYALCMMNLLVHNIPVSMNQIKQGNTILDPQLVDGKVLIKFDVIVANPPANLSNWGRHQVSNDYWNRFQYGIPPNGSADYAFIQHILSTLDDEGRAAVLVPNGVLFRGGAEGDIRKRIIQDNLIDAVIALPSNMLYSTTISTSLLLLSKNKNDSTILFIDASNDYDDTKRKNHLRDHDIDTIMKAYRERNNIENYAYLANIGEIANNEFELSVQRYISPINLNNTVAFRTGCTKTYDIFISYSRKDTSDMKLLGDYLREEGFNIWTDETLEVGTTSWQAEIARAIENTCAMVVLLSPDSKTSVWVLKELNYAIEHGVKIFPIIVRGSSQEVVPLLLIDYQYHDFRSGITLHLKDLSFALKKYLAVEIVQPFIYGFDRLIEKTGWDLALLKKLVADPAKVNGNAENGEMYPQYSPSGNANDSLPSYQYEGQHLLVARVTSNLRDRNNPIAFVVDGKFSVTSNVIVLKAADGVSANYLKLALSVIDLSPYIRGVIPSLRKTDLLDIKIPLPPFDEQVLISEQIDADLKQIDTLKERYQKQIDILSTNSLSIVRRIFTAH